MNGLILLADGAAAAENLSIFDPASPPAESIRSLSVLVLAITGFIFLVGRRNPRSTPSFASGRPRPAPPPPTAGASARRAAPGLRQQADRDRLDGGAGADRLRPGAGHGPHPLGGERPAAAARSRATTRCSSRWSAASGGGSTRYDRYDGRELGFTTANELHIPASEDGVPAAGLPDPEVRRRVPQLLGAPAGRQDRPDPGPHQQHVVPDRPARPVPRPVRRVLRHAARQHAPPRGRRFARATSSAGWRTSGSRPWTIPTSRAGRGGVPRASRASTATGCAAPPAQGTYAPDLTHLMSRQTLASGMIAEHAREPAALGGRPADRSSRAA